MELLHDFDSVKAYLRANMGLRWLTVSPLLAQIIRDEIEMMPLIKPSSRPTYGPPFGNIDRFLWDEMRGLQKRSMISIYGIPIRERGLR